MGIVKQSWFGICVLSFVGSGARANVQVEDDDAPVTRRLHEPASPTTPKVASPSHEEDVPVKAVTVGISHTRAERVQALDEQLRAIRARIKGPPGSASAKLWAKAQAVCASGQCSYGKENIAHCLTPAEHKTLLDRVKAVLRTAPNPLIGSFVEKNPKFYKSGVGMKLGLSERDLFTLTATAYGESRGFIWPGNHTNSSEKIWGKATDTLGRAQMAAVMYTIVRRTIKLQKNWIKDECEKVRKTDPDDPRCKFYPTPSGLALESQQFSCWHPYDAASACQITDGSSLPYQRALNAFADLMDPEFDVSEEMLSVSHYHATSQKNPWNFPRIMEPKVHLPSPPDGGVWINLNEKGVSPYQHLFYRGDR